MLDLDEIEGRARDDIAAAPDLEALERIRVRLLGKKGETIKAVSQAARAEIGEFLGREVHLFLTVKVRPQWLEEAERYSEMGLDFRDGA